MPRFRDANLTLTNEATGISRTAKSYASGGYSITAISPGRYDLAVSAAGFKTTINKGIQLTISQAERLTFSSRCGRGRADSDGPGRKFCHQRHERAIGRRNRAGNVAEFPADHLRRAAFLRNCGVDAAWSHHGGTGNA